MRARWIEHPRQLPGAAGVAQPREAGRGPGRGAVVLAGARCDALAPHPVHRWLAAWQGAVRRQSRHGRAQCLWPLLRPGLQGPALGRQLDAAGRVGDRAERIAAVEPGPAIPLAIPAVFLALRAQRQRRAAAGGGEAEVGAVIGHFGEALQHGGHEESQGDAFDPARDAFLMQARRRRRQAARTEAQATAQAVHAVFVQVVALRQRGVQHGMVAGGGQVARQRIRQPQEILDRGVGRECGRGAQQGGAQQFGPRVRARQGRLQARGRIGFAHHGADRLARQPAIDAIVERGVGSVHADGAERVAPPVAQALPCGGGGLRSAMALHDGAGVQAAGAGHAQHEHQFALRARFEGDGDLQRRARVEPRAERA